MIFFLGAGFGSYQAVDFALVMDVLPVEKDKAKDLAVWHQVRTVFLYTSFLCLHYIYSWITNCLKDLQEDERLPISISNKNTFQSKIT